MGVQADVLLRGAWYALEQSGLLLADAVILHSNKSHASAVVLALLAREELGKYKILVELWRKASGGVDVSVGEVRKVCEDHVEKQRQGQLSTTYRMEGPSGFANLLQERSKKLGTSEYADLDKQVTKIDRLKAKQTPEKRHSTRLKAMYVDINETGTDWNRPHLLSESEARNCLSDAMNDYIVKRGRLMTLEILKYDDPNLATAINEWNDRPELPVIKTVT